MQQLSLNCSIFTGTGVAQLRDQNYVKFQFLGTRDAWLGCPNSVCSLQTCSNYGKHPIDGRCYGEEFQIIGEGPDQSSIRSGQRIRIHYQHENNTWIGCSDHFGNRCKKENCSGTSLQGKIFTNNRCWGEAFNIYARGKNNGEIINNGDLVMIYYRHLGRYLTIQKEYEGSETSLNYCPGKIPPAYLTYSICSKNVFRIYRDP